MIGTERQRAILDYIREHETISICGDLYMAFSNCPQALSTENGGAWFECGHYVEQGKEAVQWMKLGYLLDAEQPK